MTAACILASPHGALATGTLDQSLPGDPGCALGVPPFGFDTAKTTSGHMQQEFVPRGDALASLDVCVSSTTSTVVTISVLSGTAGSPGALLASVPANLGAGADPVFLHVELGSIAITAGSTHVIDVQGASAISWYGNAPGGAYVYDPGVSNACGEVDSFAFRTYLVNPPTAPQSGAVTPCVASVTATPTASPTKTVTPTPTPTRTSTPTPSATSTVVPTNTPPPPGAPPPIPTPATAGPGTVTPAASVSGTPATTPTPSVSARFTLPDVGDGLAGQPRRGVATDLMAVAVVLVAAGVAAGRRGRAGSR
jgi:hypothetical protein